MIWKFRRLFLALALVSGGLGFSALAQEEPGTAPPTQEERLRDLEQKQKILERKLELKEESEQAKDKESVSAGAGKDGFYLKSANGDFLIKLRGLVDLDGRYFVLGYDKNNTTFLARRARPILEGTVFKYYDFYLQPDFGGGTAVLYDAYLDTHYWPQFRVRVGKFKPPVGLERLQSVSDNTFVELALPSNLVTNRDIGVQLWGDVGQGVLLYALGVFNGEPDGANADKDNNGDKDLAGRVFLQPFKST
jgi:phosphate-selective porin OprO and OprP